MNSAQFSAPLMPLARAHYRLQFPDKNSLGSGDPPAAWKAEYDRVAAAALSSLLLTQASFEGGHGGGEKLFPQEVLLEALHDRRSELDDDYTWRTDDAASVAQRNFRPSGIRVSAY